MIRKYIKKGLNRLIKETAAELRLLRGGAHEKKLLFNRLHVN